MSLHIFVTCAVFALDVLSTSSVLATFAKHEHHIIHVPVKIHHVHKHHKPKHYIKEIEIHDSPSFDHHHSSGHDFSSFSSPSFSSGFGSSLNSLDGFGSGLNSLSNNNNLDSFNTRPGGLNNVDSLNTRQGINNQDSFNTRPDINTASQNTVSSLSAINTAALLNNRCVNQQTFFRNCLSQLSSFTRPLGFQAETATNGLNSVCNSIRDTVTCVNEFSANCATNTERTFLLNSILGARNILRLLCDGVLFTV